MIMKKQIFFLIVIYLIKHSLIAQKNLEQLQYFSAQQAKVYVYWGTEDDPNGKGKFIFKAGVLGMDDYFHTSFNNPHNTLLNAFVQPKAKNESEAKLNCNINDFNKILMHISMGMYTKNDSINLLTLASLCPYDEGGVVYQARALYNLINDTYFNYTNNCTIALGNRLYDNLIQNENQRQINVLLKSTVRPNPSNGEFFIDFRDDIKKDKMVEISIYDAAGKMIYYKIEEPGLTTAHINENFVKGIYLIKIKNADGSLDIHKIVIE